MFRVLTVAREYGSGGGLIARRVAEKLGWNLLDKALVEAIARSAQVDPDLARQYDERADSWLHRVARRGLWHGAFEGVAAVSETEVFDAETVAALGKSLIAEAHSRGNCVIVGRGAQCVLQDRADVLHVFVHAPRAERIARLRRRVPSASNIEQLMRSTDQRRADFIRLYFGCDWKNIHLYHMLISSELGEETVADMIIEAIQRGGEPCA
ncbi:MAG: cytidylate kinase-like family protein [Bryobacteraceae bacterium]